MYIVIFSHFMTSKIFEIGLIFLIKPFLYLTKKSWQKEQNYKSFLEEIKSIFARNCLRPKSASYEINY